jgi:hypothetical protein
MIANCTLEMLNHSSAAARRWTTTGQAAARRTAQLPGPRIAPFQIGDEASDLLHSPFVKARKPFLKTFFDATERRRPEDYPPEEEEWRSDRSRQQQPPDSPNDEKDAELFGNLDPRVSQAIVSGQSRDA